MLNATVVFKTLRRLGCSKVMVSSLSAGEDKNMVPLFGSKSVQESIAQLELHRKRCAPSLVQAPAGVTVSSLLEASGISTPSTEPATRGPVIDRLWVEMLTS